MSITNVVDGGISSSTKSEQGNKQKSVFMTDYTRTFEAKDKYLLIPVEDQATENKVQLSVDGTLIGEPMTIRIAQNKTTTGCLSLSRRTRAKK